MQLATDATDYAAGPLGIVELAASFLNDRTHRQWSKAELVEYANQAQLQLANSINALHREYFLTSATTPLVADQAYYAMPSDLTHLMGLEVVNDVSTDREPAELVTVLLSQRRFYEGLDKAQKKDDYRFFFIQGTSFKMEPEAAAVNGEQLRIYYVKRLSRLAANTDVSEIPAEHHELLAMDTARRALVKFTRENVPLERLRAEAFAGLKESIPKYAPNAEDRVEPFYGSYGPCDEVRRQRP